MAEERSGVVPSLFEESVFQCLERSKIDGSTVDDICVRLEDNSKGSMNMKVGQIFEEAKRENYTWEWFICDCSYRKAKVYLFRLSRAQKIRTSHTNEDYSWYDKETDSSQSAQIMSNPKRVLGRIYSS